MEDRVRLERLGEVFRALRTDLVVKEPASDGEIRVSAAIDSGQEGVRRAAAHSSEVRALFSLRPAARCSAAFASSRFSRRLRARRVREHARMRAREYAIGSECQRLLTLRITRVAAHLSDLVAAFDVIRLAMTVAERTVSLLPERSINSMGSSPRSCLIERA